MRSVVCFNYLPSIYNTRHSTIFTLYGRKVALEKLKTNIISNAGNSVVLVSNTPHYLCASECLKNIQAVKELGFINRSLIYEYIVTNKLDNSIRYIEYIKKAHPETDEILTFTNFMYLIRVSLTKKYEFSVLVQRRLDKSGHYWLLIDGLHRASILLALNQINVAARVKFP